MWVGSSSQRRLPGQGKFIEGTKNGTVVGFYNISKGEMTKIHAD